MTHRPLPSKGLLDEAFYPYVLNPKPGICPVKCCTNLSKGTGNNKYGSLCAKHDIARWRKRHPKTSAYYRLRNHAKARNILFTITYEYFKRICEEGVYDWSNRPGDQGRWPSIDRIDCKRGYVPGNIRVLTISENSMKNHRARYLPENARYYAMEEEERFAYQVEDEANRQDEEVPF